mgnify:CR=1 FL=1
MSLFKWFCHPDLHPYIEGDLLELYQENLEKNGRRRANQKLLLDVLLLFRPNIIKPLKRWKYNNEIAMFKNYCKVGLRNLWKKKAYSAINILGLAIGLAVTCIMTLFVLDEISYDTFHKDGDRIYRVSKQYFNGDKIVETVPFRSYLLDRMAEEIPAIQSTTTLKPFQDNQLIHLGEAIFSEKKLAFADSNFFSFFTFPLLEGRSETVLQAPYTAVISKSKASEYFKGKSPLGETITIEGAYDKVGFDVKVTGVFEDMPQNSHFRFDFLISMKTGELENDKRGIYSFPMKYGYLKTHPSQDIAEVNELIPAIEKQYAPSFYADYDMHLSASPLFDIHLYSHKERELGRNGDMGQVYLFMAIALLILLIACFNYVNLTTAVATEKAKEIGVRKVAGASRKQLFLQFLTEAGLISYLALLIAIVLIKAILPYFNAFAGKALSIATNDIRMFSIFILLTFLVSIFSGLYPALILSKGQLKQLLSKGGPQTMRKALVILQFSISSILIIASLVIFSQWRMLSNQQYSFHPEQIINVPVNSLKIRDNYPLIKEELLRHAAIVGVAGSNKDFISELRAFNGLTVPGHEGYIDMYYAAIDADFFDLYNKKILKGRNFRDYTTDSLGAIILNESAVRLIGKKTDEALGLKIDVYEGYSPKVLGVVEDFQFQSLHGKVVPMYFQLLHTKEVIDQLKVITVKINSDKISSALKAIEAVIGRFDDEVAFDYSFLEKDIQLAYQREEQFSQLLGLLTIIGILIAGMGIFGITTAVTQQRQKEFGVRKVLGASTWNIALLINKGFVKLVILANVIGFPIAYIATKNWLQDFSTQVEVGPLSFFIALLASLGIAILGSSYWSIKAAVSNPVEAIKAT